MRSFDQTESITNVPLVFSNQKITLPEF